MEELQNALWSFVKGFMSFAVVLIIGALVVKIALIPVKKLLLKSKIDLTAKTTRHSQGRHNLACHGSRSRGSDRGPCVSGHAQKFRQRYDSPVQQADRGGRLDPD